MNSKRFEDILAAYGADPLRWPEAEREDALRHQAGESAAAARALDRALDLDVRAVDVDAFTARALANFAKPSASVTPLPRRANRAPLWALAACAVLGLAIGFGAGSFAPSDAAYQTVAGAFDGGYGADEDSGG